MCKHVVATGCAGTLTNTWPHMHTVAHAHNRTCTRPHMHSTAHAHEQAHHPTLRACTHEPPKPPPLPFPAPCVPPTKAAYHPRHAQAGQSSPPPLARAGDAIVWQRDLSSGSSVPDPFASMTMDSLDHRRLCLSGPGHLALVTLTDLASGEVAVKHFKLDARGAGMLRHTCMCMRVLHTHAHTHTGTPAHTNTHVHKQAHAYTRTHKHLPTHYAHAHTHVRTRAHAHMRVHKHTCIACTCRGQG